METQVLSQKLRLAASNWGEAWRYAKRIVLILIFTVEILAAGRVIADIAAPMSPVEQQNITDVRVLQAQMTTVDKRLQTLDDRTWFILTSIIGGLVIQTYFQVKTHNARKGN